MRPLEEHIVSIANRLYDAHGAHITKQVYEAKEQDFWPAFDFLQFMGMTSMHPLYLAAEQQRKTTIEGRKQFHIYLIAQTLCAEREKFIESYNAHTDLGESPLLRYFTEKGRVFPPWYFLETTFHAWASNKATPGQEQLLQTYKEYLSPEGREYAHHRKRVIIPSSQPVHTP